MTTQTQSLAAILLISSLAACSPGEEPTIVSEARAAAPTSYDFGWRTPESPSAVADGTVHEYY